MRAAWRHSTGQGLDGIAVEGKRLRGARRLGAHAVPLLSACWQRCGLVLGEVALPAASNHVGAVAALLDTFVLAGETVTFDALFTSYAIATPVVQQGGAPAAWASRGIRPRCSPPAGGRPPGRHGGSGRRQTVRLAHGRIEARTLLAADARDIAWPHARQVLRLHRRFVHKATDRVLSDQTVYAVTSLPPAQAAPAALLQLWQAHWLIENRLHWVRDVVFGEAEATTHTTHAPQAFAALRNLATALLHLTRGPAITPARQYYAAHLAALFRQLRLAPPGLRSSPDREAGLLQDRREVNGNRREGGWAGPCMRPRPSQRQGPVHPHPSRPAPPTGCGINCGPGRQGCGEIRRHQGQARPGGAAYLGISCRGGAPTGHDDLIRNRQSGAPCPASSPQPDSDAARGAPRNR